MDLSKIKPGERMVEILHPATKEPIGIRIGLVHVDDDSLKLLKRQMRDERLRLESKGKYLKSDTIEDNARELTFAALKSWEWYNPTGTKGTKGFDETKHANWRGDKNPEFNKKNVFDVIDTLPWVSDFIGKEMGDDEAFFPS